MHYPVNQQTYAESGNDNLFNPAVYRHVLAERNAGASSRKAMLHTEYDQKMLYQRGRQYLEARQYGQAIGQFNRLVKSNPYHAEALHHLAYCLFVTGRLEVAFKTYEFASLVSPGEIGPLLGMAHCQQGQGDFDKAMALYHQVLQQQSHNVESLLNLVLIGNGMADAALVATLTALHQSPDLSCNDRVHACFALAKIYEAQGDDDRAFTYYEEGNRLQFASQTYDEEALFQYFDLLEAVFTPEFVTTLQKLGSADETPIFVLGIPRSGTSLVEQILASHPLVHGAGEVNIMPDIVSRLLPQLTGQFGPQALTQLNPEAFQSLANHYVKTLRSHCPQAKRHIVDKMPSNLFNIGMIRILFPQARIIHCARDPMDTCWSLYRQLFSGTHPYCYDQKTLGRFHLRYQQLMRHWHRVLPQGSIYELRYEQLLENPRETITDLLDHCHLSWEEPCFDFHRTQRTVNTASMRQVRRPLYKTSLESWKPVAGKLADLRQILGLAP